MCVCARARDLDCFGFCHLLLTTCSYFVQITWIHSSEVFTEDDWKLVQLVLTLFRNLLAIQDISALQKAAGFATQILSLRDRFLELLFRENVMDLFLLVAQHVGGSSNYLHQDNWLLLEIFYYIFKGQDPELVAKAHLNSLKVGIPLLFSFFQITIHRTV